MGGTLFHGVLATGGQAAVRSGKKSDYGVRISFVPDGASILALVVDIEGKINAINGPDVWVQLGQKTFSSPELTAHEGYIFITGKPVDEIRGNITTLTKTQQLNINAPAKTVTRLSGSFITDGFLEGDVVTLSGFTNGGNNTTKTIAAGGVAALVLTLTDNTGLVTETGSGDENCVSGTAPIHAKLVEAL